MPQWVITEPAEGNVAADRAVRVSGYAWTGRGIVTTVELSDDDGATWHKARLDQTRPRMAGGGGASNGIPGSGG